MKFNMGLLCFLVLFVQLFIGHAIISDSLNNSSLNCRHQYWIHAPKTSSSFCLALQHACCKEQFETLVADITPDKILENDLLPVDQKYFKLEPKWGCMRITRKKSTFHCAIHNNLYHHKPYNPNTKENKRQQQQQKSSKSTDSPSLHFLMMLRHPKSRIFSAFSDSYHHEGMSPDDFEKLKFKMFNHSYSTAFSDIESLNSSAKFLKEFIYAAKVYLEEPAMRGCQTKMILGYECADSSFILSYPELNQTAINEAKQKLSQFFFIGLLEEYSKSISLFHRLANHDTKELPVELMITRSSDHRKAALLERHFTNYRDPYDEAIYEYGKELFHQRYNSLFVGKKLVL
jgi:hypothetical protein